MDSERRTIDKLRLVNFTAFKDLEMEFSPGINAIIGENATGKTHVLKVLYAASEAKDDADESRWPSREFWDHIAEIFLPKGRNNFYLHHKHDGELETRIFLDGLDNNHVELTLDKGLNKEDLSPPIMGFHGNWNTTDLSSCFIPANEFLSHAKNFASLYQEKYLQFDQTYYDISLKVFQPENRKHFDTIVQIHEMINAAIEGRVLFEDMEIYLVHRGTKVGISMAPLGHSKLAMLDILLTRGAIKPGTILFWDEPEANLNPKLVKVTIRIMLLLKEMGVQIFFATHNYVMLKLLDLLAEEKHQVGYHALYRNDDGDIKCESKDALAELQQNAILDVYEDIYNMELERTMDRIGDDDS